MNRAELARLLEEIGPVEDKTFVKQALDHVDGWVARGDGCAIYRNEEIGHPEMGHVKFVSFGGPEAQLQGRPPPKTLPDIGDQINWRYQLVDTYEGEGSSDGPTDGA